jgi:hypothetical protein
MTLSEPMRLALVRRLAVNAHTVDALKDRKMITAAQARTGPHRPPRSLRPLALRAGRGLASVAAGPGGLVTRRLTDPALLRGPGPSSGRNADFYLGTLWRSGSRFEAESRLAQALDDKTLSDEDFHSARLYFDHLAEKGWPS